MNPRLGPGRKPWRGSCLGISSEPSRLFVPVRTVAPARVRGFLLAAGLALRHHCRHIRDMRSAKKKATAAKLRSWRVSILRARLHYRGDVEAPDQRSAEAEAARQFNLSDDERKCLVVQARD